MINVIFCDDNPQYSELIREQVKKVCHDACDDNKTVAIGPSFTNGEEALRYIQKNKVDTIFLDIDMPSMTGFDLAKILCEQYKKIKIIFVSAYDNYVYNAFDFYPFAYLRKTHIEEDMPNIMKRLTEKFHEENRTVMLTTGDGVRKVSIDSIIYAESRKNYYDVYCKEGMIRCRGTMNELEKILDSRDFFRIHSAYIVNLEYVETIEKIKCVLISHVSLPVAQSRRANFKKQYMDYLRRYIGT